MAWVVQVQTGENEGVAYEISKDDFQEEKSFLSQFGCPFRIGWVPPSKWKRHLEKVKTDTVFQGDDFRW